MGIENVKIFPLKKIEDERGAVMHMLRSNQEHFQTFGEIYFSLVNPGVVKGWKLHKKIHQNMAVPEGEIKIVIFDSRKDSSTFGQTQEIVFGNSNYCLLQLPPGVWYSFKAISPTHAIIANCTTAPHDPEESIVLPLNTPEISYNWNN